MKVSTFDKLLMKLSVNNKFLNIYRNSRGILKLSLKLLNSQRNVHTFFELSWPSMNLWNFQWTSTFCQNIHTSIKNQLIFYWKLRLSIFQHTIWKLPNFHSNFHWNFLESFKASIELSKFRLKLSNLRGNFQNILEIFTRSIVQNVARFTTSRMQRAYFGQAWVEQNTRAWKQRAINQLWQQIGN